MLASVRCLDLAALAYSWSPPFPIQLPRQRLALRSSLARAIALLSLIFAQPTLARPATLGTIETVIGGQVALLDEKCTYPGLGFGYAAALTNPRGTVLGTGCAKADIFPGSFVVLWATGSSDTYPFHGVVWTTRGRVVFASALNEAASAEQAAKTAQREQEKEKQTQESLEASMLAALTNHKQLPPWYAFVHSSRYPTEIIIAPAECVLVLQERDQTGLVMREYSAGRVALGLSSDRRRVVHDGCALPSRDGGVILRIYGIDDPERPQTLPKSQVKWEAKGQEWVAQFH